MDLLYTLNLRFRNFSILSKLSSFLASVSFLHQKNVKHSWISTLDSVPPGFSFLYSTPSYTTFFICHIESPILSIFFTRSQRLWKPSTSGKTMLLVISFPAWRGFVPFPLLLVSLFLFSCCIVQTGLSFCWTILLEYSKGSVRGWYWKLSFILLVVFVPTFCLLLFY